VGIGLIGTVSASVAAWFVRRHSEPSTEPDDVMSADVETAAATTADSQALLLDRLDQLAAEQDEISRHADRAAATADQQLMTRPCRWLLAAWNSVATDCAITRRRCAPQRISITKDADNDPDTHDEHRGRSPSGGDVRADRTDRDQTTLTMPDVSPSTLYFSDRPERVVGHLTTEQFVEQWTEGPNSFFEDSPNAVLSYVGTGEDTPSDAVVVLRDPVVSGSSLSYSIEGARGRSAGPSRGGHLVYRLAGPPAEPGVPGRNEPPRPAPRPATLGPSGGLPMT
jgi:hypothetical protein